MSTINNQKTLKEFVKSKVIDIPIFPVNKDKLIDNLVHAIENEKIIHINGANGTGKEYFINEVISPKLENDLNVKEITIYDNIIPIPSYKISELLNEESSRFIILSRNKIVSKSKIVDDTIEDQAFGKLLEIAFDIYLPDLQEQFLEYPKIIESYIKKIFNKSAGQILINTVGYLETLISGLPNNAADLESIIKAEKTPTTINYSYKKNQQYGIFLTFNIDLDVKSERKEIWRSIKYRPVYIELSKLIEFNDSFIRSKDRFISNINAGPYREHPQSIIYEQIKKYCISFLHSQNVENINNQIFEPIDDKIKKINSSKNAIQTIVETIYIFAKSNLELETSDPEQGRVYIKQYNTLEISQYRDNSDHLQSRFKLSGDSVRPITINIKPRAATFLLFLANERDSKGKDWIKNIQDHNDILLEIVTKLMLPTNLVEDDKVRAVQPLSWISKKNNKLRTKIVNEINDAINKGLDSKVYLFEKNQKLSGITGRYSLINSIQEIILPW